MSPIKCLYPSSFRSRRVPLFVFQVRNSQPPTTSVFPHIVLRIQADDFRPDVVMGFCDIAITSSRCVFTLIRRSNFSMHKKRKMGVCNFKTDFLMQR